MQLAWITDPHLNHCALEEWEVLVRRVRGSGCDAVVVSGDISEGEDVVFQLHRMADAFAVPIYFVLGNHDFYHSSLERTVRAVRAAVANDPRLHYLTDLPAVSFGPGIAMLGEDGWGDASVGDYERSPVRLSDFQLIDDFRLRAPALWRGTLAELGEQAALRLAGKLERAVREYAHILVVTHVPPFREACWYQGRISDDWWAPFFVCGRCGEVLRQTAERRPGVQLHVICGHTHSGGVAQMADNLTVTTAGAAYGYPEVAAIINGGSAGWTIG